MKHNNDPAHPEILDKDTIELLSAAPGEHDLDADRMQSLRARVMAQIEVASPPLDLSDLVIVRADDGDWIDVTDHLKKKVLNVDREKNIETFLLRVLPGAAYPAHTHSSDEHCMVLEGSIAFGDLQLNSGDYHLAPKGSYHQDASSLHGALLLIQTGLEQQASI